MAIGAGPGRDRNNLPEAPRRLWATVAAGALIVAAGVAAYSNSFGCAFVFDDLPSILDNRAIRGPGAIWRAMISTPAGTTQQGRPVVNASLAVNYALGGLKVWGYHAFNLAVHLLAGLTLFGIIRRTLLLPALRDRLGWAATWLAFFSALLWVVHPLQTESVTYIIQRAESLMGLFYLLTLYCFIRGLASPRAWLWHAAAVAACAGGMGSKEVMATAPLAVLLYDVVFVCGSPLRAWRIRRGLYLGLAATWAVLAALAVSAGSRGGTAGLGLAQVSPTEYAVTQFGVILHYFRLSFWPGWLCLDYAWPVARSAAEIAPGAVVVGVLVTGTVWGLASLRRAGRDADGMIVLSGKSHKAGWGFLGAWLLVILAPTSSIMPLADLAFEHRMYVPLAAVTTAVVVAVYVIAYGPARRVGALAGRLRYLAIVVGAASAVALGWATYSRNLDYRSGLSIYEDAARKRPDNPRAQSNLGYVLVAAGQLDRALAACNRAIELRSDFPEAYNNRGLAFAAKGQYEQAIVDYDHVLKLMPNHAEAHNNRGVALAHLGKLDEAMADYVRAIELDPAYADAYNNRGVALAESGKYDEAIRDYACAIEFRPDFAEAYGNRGMAFLNQGRYEQAIRDCSRAIELKPAYADAYSNRGAARHKAGMTEQAIADYARAIQLKPDYAAAHNNRGFAYAELGRFDEAMADFETAIRIDPNDANTYDSRASAYYRMGEYDKAWQDVRTCRKLGGKPDAKMLEDLVKASGRTE